MDRSSSFGSESSAGSALTSKTSASRIVARAEKGEGIEGGQSQQPLLRGLFGTLYTLAKEKINDNRNFAIATILIDFIMVLLLFIVPEYPWALEEDGLMYKLSWYIEFHKPIAYKGYTFYLAIFYLLAGMLMGSVVICIWVGWCFTNDSFPFLWPIQLLRVVVSVFFNLFYIPALNIYLISFQCRKDHGVWIHNIYHTDCMAMPHVVHASFGIFSAVLFAVVAFLMVMADHELEPMSKSTLASPHSMCELRAIVLKTIITGCDILFIQYPHTQAAVYVVCCWLILYYSLEMVPNYTAWVNSFRCGLYAILFWVSLILCILVYSTDGHLDHKSGHYKWDEDNGRQRAALTTTMFAGTIPVFLLGAALAYWRIWHLFKVALKFEKYDSARKYREYHRFKDEYEVEVAARVGRVWDDDDNHDPETLEIAETVLKAGLSMMPDSVYLHIVYSNFLIEVRGNNQQGWAELEAARKLEPNLSFQFSIFTREQEHKQKSAGLGGGGGGEAVDLVSYVEFQRNFRMLLVYHKASLAATRDFWKLLLRTEVDLVTLAHSFRRIEEMESMAEKTYKLVLERYPKNSKLLRSYGQFLEHIKNDPWGAARYYSEAEKQEEQEQNQEQAMNLDMVAAGSVDHKNDAVITITAQGIIQMVNKAANTLMGYKKGELEGKNISCLMPQPFAGRHNTYLRNYVTTGKAKILDRSREVVALHKDHYVFPVRLVVTKVSGEGTEAMFMGVVRPVEPDPQEVKAWLMTTGTVLCVDQSFLDYAGWAPADLVGHEFNTLGTDTAQFDKLLEIAATSTEEELEDGAAQLETSIRHKYGDPLGVRIKITLGGTESQRLLVATMRRMTPAVNMMAVNHKGRLIYANTQLATLLGYKLKQLREKDIGALMPPPYGLLHTKWLKEAETLSPKACPSSCRNSISTVLLSSNGTHISTKLHIAAHQVNRDTIFSVEVHKTTAEAALDERRLLLRLTPDGNIQSTGDSSAALFGVEPSILIGHSVAEIVDMLADWTKSGNKLSSALNALAERSGSKPGSSWRVGVTPLATAHAFRDAGLGSSFAKLNARAAEEKWKVKHAVMQVELEESDEVGAEPCIVVKLWRADMLTGIMEINSTCGIVKADLMTTLLFGLPQQQMQAGGLCRLLMLPSGTTLEDLMGYSGQKKGGMKQAHVHKVGPKKTLQGRHGDGLSVSVSFQATLKDGSNQQRAVAILKVLQPVKGNLAVLQKVVQDEEEDEDELIQQQEIAAKPLAVPSLALAQVTKPKQQDAEDLIAGTARSSVLATARGVQLELLATPRAPADLTSTQDDEDLPSPGAAHLRLRAHADKSALSSGDHTSAHVGFGKNASVAVRRSDSLPDDNNSGPLEREFDVSSDSADEPVVAKPRAPAAAAPVPASSKKKKKGPATEEEKEKEAEAASAKKAQEWLETDFGFKEEDGDPDDLPPEGLALPGAVWTGNKEEEDAEDDVGNMAMEEKKSDAQSEGASGSESGLVSDYSKGKRLKKLLRLLNSATAQRALAMFKNHMWLVMAVLLAVHIACFTSIIVFMNKQKVYTKDISAAGGTINLLHRSLTDVRVLEAIQRGYGYNSADTPTFAADLFALMADLEYLHQGLYMGFDSLAAVDDPRMYTLWHDETTPVLKYSDTVPPSSSYTNTSLFNLGGLFISAGREVQYAAQHSNASLTNNRQWLFMQDNGPTVLYQGYLHTLNFIVSRAQISIKELQTMVLTLMCVEGIFVCFSAIAYITWLLRRVSTQRAALFTVFLTIPNGFLKQLANKSVKLSAEEDGSDDEDDAKATEQATAEKSKSAAPSEAGGLASRRNSVAAMARPSEATGIPVPGATPRASKGIRFSVENLPDNVGGPGAVEASRPSYAGRLQDLLDGNLDADEDQSVIANKILNGKKLTKTGADIYKMTWPLVLWALLIVILYSVSYSQFSVVDSALRNLKLGERSAGQAARLEYLVTELVLTPNPTYQASLQKRLLQEVQLMDSVWTTALYGGNTLPDAQVDSSDDYSTGVVFRDMANAQVLFLTQSCLRDDQGTCFNSSSMYYEATRNGLDTMVRRYMQEASLLAQDSIADVKPSSTRYDYLWKVGHYDMRDGLEVANTFYKDDALASFDSQGTTHTILLVVAIICGLVFVVMLFKPFLNSTAKESRRVAELLTQLPKDMDVEGMVSAAWKVVLQAKLAAEEAASRRQSMTAGNSTFKSAASTIVSKLRASLDLDAGNNVQRMGQAQQEDIEPWHSGFYANEPSSSRVPLLSGTADTVVHLARSSRVMPTPRGSGMVPGAQGMAGPRGSGVVPGINTDLVRAMQPQQYGNGSGGHSPRLFSPRQSAEFARHSMDSGRMPLLNTGRSSLDMQRNSAVPLQRSSMPQVQQQPQSQRRSLEKDMFTGSPRYDSNRPSQQQVRTSTIQLAEELAPRGSPRFSQTFAEQSPRQQGQRRESNRASMQQVRTSAIQLADEAAVRGSPRFSQTFAEQLPRQQAAASRMGAAAGQRGARSEHGPAASRAEPARRVGGHGASPRQGARFSQQLDEMV